MRDRAIGKKLVKSTSIQTSHESSLNGGCNLSSDSTMKINGEYASSDTHYSMSSEVVVSKCTMSITKLTSTEVITLNSSDNVVSTSSDNISTKTTPTKTTPSKTNSTQTTITKNTPIENNLSKTSPIQIKPSKTTATKNASISEATKTPKTYSTRRPNHFSQPSYKTPSTTIFNISLHSHNKSYPHSPVQSATYHPPTSTRNQVPNKCYYSVNSKKPLKVQPRPNHGTPFLSPFLVDKLPSSTAKWIPFVGTKVNPGPIVCLTNTSSYGQQIESLNPLSTLPNHTLNSNTSSYKAKSSLQSTQDSLIQPNSPTPTLPMDCKQIKASSNDLQKRQGSLSNVNGALIPHDSISTITNYTKTHDPIPTLITQSNTIIKTPNPSISITTPINRSSSICSPVVKSPLATKSPPSFPQTPSTGSSSTQRTSLTLDPQPVHKPPSVNLVPVFSVINYHSDSDDMNQIEAPPLPSFRKSTNLQSKLNNKLNIDSTPSDKLLPESQTCSNGGNSIIHNRCLTSNSELPKFRPDYTVSTCGNNASIYISSHITEPTTSHYSLVTNTLIESDSCGSSDSTLPLANLVNLCSDTSNNSFSNDSSTNEAYANTDVNSKLYFESSCQSNVENSTITSKQPHAIIWSNSQQVNNGSIGTSCQNECSLLGTPPTLHSNPAHQQMCEIQQASGRLSSGEIGTDITDTSPNISTIVSLRQQLDSHSVHNQFTNNSLCQSYASQVSDCVLINHRPQDFILKSPLPIANNSIHHQLDTFDDLESLEKEITDNDIEFTSPLKAQRPTNTINFTDSSPCLNKLAHGSITSMSDENNVNDLLKRLVTIENNKSY